MRRVWSNIKTRAREGGFSAVEILLAATVFGLLATALTGAIIYGRSGTATSGYRAQALALAEEGCEAVRNIRDAAYSNLNNGTFGLSLTAGQWTFSGTSDSTGVFTRQITVAQVDSTRKTVTCTVSWTINGVARSVAATTRLTNWSASITPPVTPGPIMMVYSKTTTVPFYRIWTGLNWSGEGSANAVVGNINYIVAKSSRTRNETIVGVQTTTGAIYVQVYNGDTSTWGTATQIGTGPTTTRSFDIAYEKNGDRAIIAYTPSSGAIDYAVRTWNGTTLSGATNVTTSPTSGAINWIETRQNPLSASNEIALILLDANADVYGMRWNGTSWVAMETVITWDTTASTATRKGIDVEYEQTSGEAIFMWGDSLADANNYRTWNGTTLANLATLSIPAMDGIANWVQLAARPSSNEIMYGVQDANATPDLNTVLWNGSSWGTPHTEHSAGTENINSRNFDIVWETHSTNLGDAWLMWGDSATITAKQWTAGAWLAGGVMSLSDDTTFIRLRADSATGAVFAAQYEDTTSASDDIAARRLTGGSSTWSAKDLMWSGPTTASPSHFKVDIATP